MDAYGLEVPTSRQTVTISGGGFTGGYGKGQLQGGTRLASFPHNMQWRYDVIWKVQL